MSNVTEQPTAADLCDEETGLDESSGTDVGAGEVRTDDWETIRSERDQYLDALQRSQADFANYRKRAARDQATALEQARASVLRSMLLLIDALDRAREHDASTGPLWAAALDALQREDVERIAPNPGDAFDPAVHDAVSSTGSGGDAVVASVIRAGYRVGDQVLRPAEIEVTTTDHSTDDAPGSGDGGAVSGDDAEED